MNKNFSRLIVVLLVFAAANVWSQETQQIRTNAEQQGRAPQGTSLQLTPQAALSPDATTESQTSAVMEKVPPEEQAPPVESISVVPDSLRAGYDVEIFQNVLKMADLTSLKYKDAVESAKSGNVQSIYALLDFHRVVDGVDALNHSVTCLELIPLTGDEPFALAVSKCSPKLKKLIVDRLILAQGRTKKKYLLKSITEWAPMSWAYLNGRAHETPREQSESQESTTPQPSSPSKGQ